MTRTLLDLLAMYEAKGVKVDRIVLSRDEVNRLRSENPLRLGFGRYKWMFHRVPIYLREEGLTGP